jgi:hypothetical protein
MKWIFIKAVNSSFLPFACDEATAKAQREDWGAWFSESIRKPFHSNLCRNHPISDFFALTEVIMCQKLFAEEQTQKTNKSKNFQEIPKKGNEKKFYNKLSPTKKPPRLNPNGIF